MTGSLEIDLVIDSTMNTRISKVHQMQQARSLMGWILDLSLPLGTQRSGSFQNSVIILSEGVEEVM
jgi:hypothetical protein